MIASQAGLTRVISGVQLPPTGPYTHSSLPAWFRQAGFYRSLMPLDTRHKAVEVLINSLHSDIWWTPSLSMLPSPPTAIYPAPETQSNSNRRLKQRLGGTTQRNLLIMTAMISKTRTVMMEMVTILFVAILRPLVPRPSVRCDTCSPACHLLQSLVTPIGIPLTLQQRRSRMLDRLPLPTEVCQRVPTNIFRLESNAM